MIIDWSYTSVYSHFTHFWIRKGIAPGSQATDYKMNNSNVPSEARITPFPEIGGPTVSVIISNYNYGRYLGTAIKSVLDQTYDNIEIIVVDDGSSDESHRVIAGFSDRIKTIFNDHHGQCAAINSGFSMSHGEIIVFLDADDILIDDAIQRFVDSFADNKTITKSQGFMLGVDAMCRDLHKKVPYQLSPSGDYKQAVLENGPWVCDHAWTSGNAWARWFLADVFPLPEYVDNQAFPDGCLNPLSVLYGPVASLSEPVAYYRIHDSNHGPVALRFTALSLHMQLTRMQNSFTFAAERAARIGIRVPLDDWLKWKHNWKDNLSLYAISLMDKRQSPPGFLQMIMTPFKTRKKSMLKAVGQSVILFYIRLIPRKRKLVVIKRILGIKPGHESGGLKGTEVGG